jgi:hypothetical protein
MFVKVNTLVLTRVQFYNEHRRMKAPRAKELKNEMLPAQDATHLCLCCTYIGYICI